RPVAVPSNPRKNSKVTEAARLSGISSWLCRPSRLVWRCQSSLCRRPCVGGRIARRQRGLVVLHGATTLLLNVIDTPEIDVAPGQHARIVHRFGGLLKAGARLFHLAGKRGDPRQDKGRVSRAIAPVIMLQDLISELLRSFTVAGRKLLLRDGQQPVFIRRRLNRAYNLRRCLVTKHNFPRPL